MPTNIGGLEVETVADILGDKPEARKEFGLAILSSYEFAPLTPGIYFGLDDLTYHAVPALSSGGIKYLAASPMVYWDKCRWMNPDFEEQEEKAHLLLGKAYECRILEGAETFGERFAAAPDRRDYPDALVTLNDIKERLVELVGTWRGCGQSKESAFEKLLEWEPHAQLWDRIVAEHAEENEGKTAISAADLRRIEIANRLVQLDDEQAAVVNQGHAQVSMFWTCAKTGVPMKARADKLLIRSIVDMKTIGNIDGSFEMWIPRTIANYRYNLQPSVYFEGAAECRKLIREHGASVIHSRDLAPAFIADEAGIAEFCANDETHAERVAWAMKWASNKAPDEWLWLFVQTKPPITRLVHYPRGGVTKMVTDELVSRMKRRFRQMSEEYDTLPWLDLADRIDLADEDIPRWATEI